MVWSYRSSTSHLSPPLFSAPYGRYERDGKGERREPDQTVSDEGSGGRKVANIRGRLYPTYIYHILTLGSLSYILPT